MFGLYSAPKPQSHQKKSKLNQKSLSKVWNQVTSQPPLPKKVLTCTEKNALKSLYFEMTASPFGKSKKKLKAIKNIIFCSDCVHQGWKSFLNPHFSRHFSSIDTKTFLRKGRGGERGFEYLLAQVKKGHQYLFVVLLKLYKSFLKGKISTCFLPMSFFSPSGTVVELGSTSHRSIKLCITIQSSTQRRRR